MSASFGDMLLNRRRQLGMSIQQVANVIKIRPQIIEYFETANFSAMPPRGYAQGMIASYARYLGLNPREVVDAYFDELNTYERVNNTGAGRFQESVAEASPHSENPTGRFLMVDSAPSSRFVQRPPQAGYISESHSPHEPVPASRLRRDGHMYGSDPHRRRALPPSGGQLPPQRDIQPVRGAGSYRAAQQVPPRRRTRPQDGVPYRAGGTGTGLVRAQAPSRPAYNDQGRSSNRAGYTQRPRGGVPPRGRGRGPAPSLFAGMDPRILFAGLATIVILLLAVVFLSFKACSAPEPQAPASQSQSTGSAKEDNNENGSDRDSSDRSDGSDVSSDSSDASDEGGDGSSKKPAVPKETKVKISIAKGKTSWVEVKVDGVGKFGDTVVGPFSKTYTVNDSIEISVTNPADVQITKNGEKVRYDSKSSGVGRVTITVPKPEPVDADGDGVPDDPDAAVVPEDGVATDTPSDAAQTSGE